MTYKVEVTFKDKETEKIHEKGSVYHCQDEQRIEMLEQSGFISKTNKENSQMAKQNKELEKAMKATKVQRNQQSEKGND